MTATILREKPTACSPGSSGCCLTRIRSATRHFESEAVHCRKGYNKVLGWLHRLLDLCVFIMLCVEYETTEGQDLNHEASVAFPILLGTRADRAAG